MDRLATASTGGDVKIRKLYTTNDDLSYKLNCYVAINSISAKFRRDDIADRLLIFNLERRQGQFVPESDLVSQIMENRDKLLSAYLVLCNRIVGHITEHGLDTGKNYEFRLADFARFGGLACEAIWGKGGRDHFMSALEEMSNSQTDFTLEGDILWEPLSVWLQDESKLGVEISTGDLYIELHDIINPIDSSGPRQAFFISSVSLGKYIKRLKANIEQRGYQVTYARKRDNSYWRFDLV
jgi:hypothetical protein